jgi:predicted SAM-dependent methyltransferase
LFKYELAGLLGRLFFSRQPPKKSRLLHLGCGDTYLDNFVNADYFYLRWIPFIHQNSKYDWLLDFRRPFKCPDDYWEGIFTEHTIEHLHYSDCLKLFKELYRTMKKGSWLRICLPGLEESLAEQQTGQSKAEVIYNLTQNYGHVSVWDAQMMFAVLKDAGFTTMQQVGYMQGNDKQLLRDSLGRKNGSLYVEVQK